MMNKELEKKLAEYKSYKAMAKELDALMAEIESGLKDVLAQENVSELMVGDFVVRNTEFTQERFDSKSFKAEHPAMYAEYVKKIQGHRFSVT